MDTMQTVKDSTDGTAHAEGKTTKMIEQTTAAIPSAPFSCWRAARSWERSR